MRWLQKLRTATGARHAVPDCPACGTRDNTIEQQRAALDHLRAELAEVRADAVSNLHALFTLHLTEEAAARADVLGIDDRQPDWVREYALTFMSECAGFDAGARVLVAATRPGHPDRPRLPGTVVEVWLDNDGEPTLFVAMDNPTDTARLLYDGPEDQDLAALIRLADCESPVLIPVAFPPSARSIDAGGWIEAIS